MSNKDRAELLRLIKTLVENTEDQNNEPIQQIKLVPHAARGGTTPGFVKTTDKEDARMLAEPDEDWDL